MLDAWLDAAAISETLSECSDATGLNLRALIGEGPEAELNQTANTQPALLAASVGLYRLWRDETGEQPALAAGHSLGEYSALVAAGSLPLADAAALVHRRGQLMQAAVAQGEGAMAAILGLEDNQVEDCCSRAEQQSGQIVRPANFNSPGQVVISGTATAVDAACALCSEAGARRAMPLSVSVPSHCPLMREAAAELQQAIDAISWQAPAFPVVQNTVARSSEDPQEITAELVSQLYSPVRWSHCVQQLIDLGAERLVECGPGKVLTGLNRRISAEVEAAAVTDLLKN